MYRGASLNLRKYRLRASSCPNIYRNSMITLDKEDEQVLEKVVISGERESLREIYSLYSFFLSRLSPE